LSFSPFAFLAVSVLMGYAWWAPVVFVVALLAVIIYSIFFGTKVEAAVKERYLRSKLKELT
jgi:pilus assembly protein TadC